METKTYALKEVAFTLNRSGKIEEHERLIRSIRHWTSQNLLEPVGSKHTGTGHSRLYSVDTIYRAAVLVELAHYRVPMTVLADSFPMLTDGSEAEWDEAITDWGPVYLGMTWSEVGSVWIMQRDMPLLYPIEEEYMAKEPDAPEPIKGGEPVPVSMIIMNLTRMFRWVKL